MAQNSKNKTDGSGKKPEIKPKPKLTETELQKLKSDEQLSKTEKKQTPNKPPIPKKPTSTALSASIEPSTSKSTSSSKASTSKCPPPTPSPSLKPKMPGNNRNRSLGSKSGTREGARGTEMKPSTSKKGQSAPVQLASKAVSDVYFEITTTDVPGNIKLKKGAIRGRMRSEHDYEEIPDIDDSGRGAKSSGDKKSTEPKKKPLRPHYPLPPVPKK